MREDQFDGRVPEIFKLFLRIMSFRKGMVLDQSAGSVPENSLIPRFMASIPDHADVEAGMVPRSNELFARFSCWSAVREDHDGGNVPDR